MATRYWVGGTGFWDNSDTTNWSATSGGASGASTPTPSDDVIFNSASSGASYIVSCRGGGVSTGGEGTYYAYCKSITTTAPAVGTLTFAVAPTEPFSSAFTYFWVYDGNVNIHGACLFSSQDTISHLPTVAGTYSVTFNSPGTNTQLLIYKFLPSNRTGVTLNFCNSNTATFNGVDLDPITLICTNATLTVGTYYLQNFAPNATSVTMTGTTLNGSSTSMYIGGSATTTWAISTLAINANNTSLLVGQNSATQPTAMGAVTFTNSMNSSWFARASTLTLTNAAITLLRGLTTSGALTLNTDSVLNNPSYTVSIGGITTLAGDASIYSTSNSASTTFTGAVTIANRGINPLTASIALIANTTTALGTFAFLNGVTLTPTGTNSSYLLANIISADAITATNTFINATTSLTVNGGVGKAFSYTVNASAIPVLVIRQTTAPYASGTYEYPCIAATSASITTPTTSFVGTNVRRVVYGQPRSSTKTANDTLAISGSTPTLTNVTFLGTSINAGATNYSGTRLGTDSLSNGFLPATGVQKFAVVPLSASVDYDTAIWALTSNGAVSADNYPLPQDTVIFDSVSNNSTIAYVATIHIGTVNMTANAGNLLYVNSGGYYPSAVYCYGNISLTGTAPTFGYFLLQLAQSGNLNRSLTVIGPDPTILGRSDAVLTLDTGNTTNFVFSGVVCKNIAGLYALSGTNEYLEGTEIGGAFELAEGFTSLEAYFSGGTHTMRGTVIYARTFNLSNGVVFPSSNYTVRQYISYPLTVAVYSNSTPTTALNGTVELTSASTFYITSANLFSIYGTTATNPLKSLKLTHGSFYLYYPRLILDTENIYLEGLTTGVNAGWTIDSGGGVRGLVKTNGGTASIANVFVNNVTASPANTFFATGTSTLTGTTTGWTLGAAPASPPSGGFLFI